MRWERVSGGKGRHFVLPNQPEPSRKALWKCHVLLHIRNEDRPLSCDGEGHESSSVEISSSFRPSAVDVVLLFLSARMSPLLTTTALLFGCWEEVGGQGKFRAYKCSFRFLSLFIFLLEKGRLRVGDLVIRIQVP
jgi:hypothetical protein